MDKEQIDFKKALTFDEKFDIAESIYSAFEKGGGCGHDLGIVGMIAILAEWEKIRTPESVKELLILCGHQDQEGAFSNDVQLSIRPSL